MRFPLTAAVVLSLTLPAAAAEPLAVLEERAFKAAAAEIAPSVVQIETFGGLDRVGDVRTGTAPTSGVVLTPDGYVMSSAFNLASKPAAVLVTLPDGGKHDAKPIATDFSRMLSLLKIEATGLPVPGTASADEAKVGQWTLAVGKAFDPKTPNASAGLLSAKDRVWGKALQTDAKTSPFNYGGPLVDLRGRMLGIVVPLSMTSDDVVAGADWYDSGIGFAVPAEQVFASFERLKAGKDLYRGTLGVAVAEPGNMLAEPKIAKVREGAPAEAAGVKADDMIVAIDGRPIATVAGVQQAIGTKYAGDTAAVTLKRGDETVTIEVTLEKPVTEKIVPPQTPAESEPKDAPPGGPPE